MPLFDFLCLDCGEVTEALVMSPDDLPICNKCNSKNLKKMLSAHSSYSGTRSAGIPGPGDTSCCGTTPADAGCAGPGSCCGKR